MYSPEISRFSPEDRFAPRPDLLVEAVGDEFLILDVERDIYFGINLLGWHLWQAIGEGLNLGEAMAQLLERFAVAAEVLQEDVEAFLRDLLRHELIERRPS